MGGHGWGRGALEGFLAPFTEELRRIENVQAMRAYLRGLELPLERKTASGIGNALDGTNSQRLQEFLTRTEWDAAALDRHRVQALAELATTGRAIVRVDVSTFRKRGSLSVGVARQSLAGARPVNQQVVVTLSYSDPVFEWPVTSDLFLPPRWEDPELRAAARVPESVPREAPSRIAARQLDEWVPRLPAIRLVSCSGAVRGPELREVLEVAGCSWLEDVPAGELPASVAEARWERVTWVDRADGPRVRLVAEVAAGGDERYLGVRRLDRAEAEEVDWFRLVGAAGFDEVRRALPQLRVAERIDRQGRERFGLADYEGRLWTGFRRHLALVRMAQARDLLVRAYE